MQCPQCGHGNVPDAKFCNQCGTALTHESRPTSAMDDLARYVPDTLLEKLRAAQAGESMRGERRTVTMLFADLQGSTAAAEQLDPEEWAEIANGAFGHLIAPVYRYEGTLARLQGDAILAFFGAPIAHEDDPARAVRAGLDIIQDIEPYSTTIEEQYGIPIAVRVGINTGLVVVGEVGSDLRVEYTALGDAINVAARMEQTAEPGTVRVTADTLELLGDSFDAVEIGPVEVKGKGEAINAHRVVGVADAVRAASTETPLVGRAEELRRLRGLLDRLDDGVGAICTIVGEAGVGKSRLLAALRDGVGEQGAVGERWTEAGDIGWLRGRAQSYERSIPHATFIALLCDWWDGVDRVDDGFERVRTAVEGALGTPDEDMAALLTQLIGGTLPTPQRAVIDALETPVLHQRTTEAVARYLTAESRRRPLVLVLDDLHWADALSLGLIEDLMALVTTEPLALLLVTRPNRDDPAWGLVESAGRDHAQWHTTLDLEALDAESTSALLERLVGEIELDDELRAAILERANGNPLFVEEIVHALDDGLGRRSEPLRREHFDVPPSLTGLLTARLDQLDEPTRHVAQVASVVGREFDLEVLAAAAESTADLDARVLELVRGGILEPRQQQPRRTYSYRHPLIRENAYNTVLLRTRRELHGRIARHREASTPDASQEIARHYLEANEPEAAFPHLVEAGRRSVRAMALSSAIRFFSTALEGVPDDADPELVLAAHEGLGETYSLVPDLTNAQAAYQSLLQFGRESGRRRMEVAALNRMGFSSATLAADFAQALVYLGGAREIAEEIEDDLGLAEYNMNACLVNALQGNFDVSVDHDDEIARLGQQAGNETVRVVGLLRKATNLIAAGRYAEARVGYAEALELAQEVGNEEAIAVLECNANAVLHLRDGDIGAAMELLRGNLPTLDRYASFYGANCHHWLGQSARFAGDVEAALTAYGAAERLGRTRSQPHAVAAGLAGRANMLVASGQAGDTERLRAEAEQLVTTPAGEFYATSTWADIAGANFHMGDLDGAAAALDGALARSSMSTAWEEPRVLLARARVAEAQGHSDTASQHLDEARSVISARGLRVYEPELFVLDGIVAMATGRTDHAVTVLTQAERTASESGQQLIVIEALGRLAELRDQSGDDTGARGLRDRAASVTEALASTIADEELRRSFRARQLEMAGIAMPDVGQA